MSKTKGFLDEAHAGRVGTGGDPGGLRDDWYGYVLFGYPVLFGYSVLFGYPGDSGAGERPGRTYPVSPIRRRDRWDIARWAQAARCSSSPGSVHPWMTGHRRLSTPSPTITQ